MAKRPLPKEVADALMAAKANGEIEPGGVWKMPDHLSKVLWDSAKEDKK